MKRILILIMLFAYAFLFAAEKRSEVDQLYLDISTKIVTTQGKMAQIGIYNDDLFWAQVGYVHPDHQDRYSIDLVKGEEYLFFTLTTGPKVRVCSMFANGLDAKYSQQNNYIEHRFVAHYTGSYKYYIFSLDRQAQGLSLSYFTRIYRRGNGKYAGL